MFNPDGRMMLALETAIDGGSVAVLKSGKPIACASGAGDLSKSEDILPVIENLLEKSGIGKSEIELIAVSDGPGSLTGLRIGLAIAKGLGDSLSVKVQKISVLEALTYQANLDGRVIAALYTKRSGVFFREFTIKDGKCEISGEIVQLSNPLEFVYKLESFEGEKVTVVSNENLMQLLTNNAGMPEGIGFLPLKGNLATILGQAITANRVR